MSNCSDFIFSLSSSIFKIKQSLERLSSSNHSVRLFWIPSHSGILGNEKADSLAKKASSCGSLLNFPLPFSDFYPLCLSITRNAFNNYLAHYSTNTGLSYFDNFEIFLLENFQFNKSLFCLLKKNSIRNTTLFCFSFDFNLQGLIFFLVQFHGEGTK